MPTKEDNRMQQIKERGFLHGALQSHIWDTRIKSANVTKMERIFGYMLGPFGVMLLQSIVNSYFNQYLTDVRGFTVSKGLWIASFMVVFPVVSKVIDAVTNVIMAKILDRTTCRQGKLRPWFILSLPIIILSIYMMFSVPSFGVKLQAVWVIVSYNLFYSVGYTMWYMAYEMSAALSTRNVKQRSGNSIAGQITKNIGTGIVSITFPLILQGICAAIGENLQVGYLAVMSIVCCVAVPLTFMQYFFTRERITEERRNQFQDDPTKIKTKEEGFGRQLHACLKDKYWIMFILLIMVYQILNALKSVSQVYYAGWVVDGNSYGNYAAIQAKFTMVAMAPMGPMLLVVVPMIKKFGRRKMIILGGIMAFVGATAAFFSAGDSTLIVYLGTAFSGIGGMFYVYTMMSYLGDVIDHVEYNKGIRCEGMTAALVGFVHSLSNGVGLGLFNLGLMLFKYRTPEKIGVLENGVAQYADQNAGAVTWINFSYQGAIALTGLLFVVLFVFFFDIDKIMPKVTRELEDRKKAECAAQGIDYIPSEELQRMELVEQKAEAERNRVAELKARCEKKGLDFEAENKKYLDKIARRHARKRRHKTKNPF